MRGFVIGRPAGVEIRLHPSVLVIVLLIVLDLATGPFRFWHPEWSNLLVWSLAVVAAVLFLGSVLLHEMAHTLVARAYGMTVDSITLFLFGGVSNIEREPSSPMIEFVVAVVGPLTSLALGVILLTASASASWPAMQAGDPTAAMSLMGPWSTMFGWLGTINILIGVFNMLPAFPLDGGRIFRSLLWAATGNVVRATRWASMLGRAFGLTMVVLGILMFFGIYLPFLGTGPIAGMWFAFIGWFLSQAAGGVYYHTVVTRALDHVMVSDLMSSSVEPVTSDLPVSALVDLLMRHDQRAFPVVDEDHLVGLVGLEDVRKISRNRWATTPVSEIMIPRDKLEVVPPTAPASVALRALGDREIDQVPVVESDRFRGLVRRQDILRWLQLTDDVPV